MQILHVYRTYFPETQGGLQEAIRQICLGTGRLGASNRVFTLAKDDSPSSVIVDAAEVIRSRSHFEVASCDFTGPAGIASFRRLAAEADLLHFHFPWPFGDLLQLVSGARRPIVVTYHSDIVRQRFLKAFYRPLMNHFLESADAIVATSPHYAASSPVLRRHAAKVAMIPLSLDPETRKTATADLLEQWRARVGDRFFLFVGVLRYYKGLHLLIDAARRTGLPVVIAGSGPEDSALRALARRAPSVHLVGQVADSDKFALIELSRAIAFPSHLRSEAFGMTLLEGAMMGKPMICTELGTGTTYVNVDGKTGVVVPPNDSAALALAMQRLAGDDVACEAMGAAAADRFTRMFTTARSAKAYVDLYARLLRGAR